MNISTPLLMSIVAVFDNIAQTFVGKPTLIRADEVPLHAASFQRACTDSSHPFSTSPQDYDFCVTAELDLSKLPFIPDDFDFEISIRGSSFITDDEL